MVIITLLLYLVGLIIIGIVGSIVFFYYLNWKRCKYFRDQGIPYIKTNYGTLIKLLCGKLSLVDTELLLYQDALKLSSPLVGASDMLGTLYLVMDLDLTRNIYVKDSDHFIDRRKFTSPNGDMLSKKMLISLEGEHWKGMRSKLSPTFTTGKIKRMFSIFEKSSMQMCEFLEKIVGPSGKDVDICESFSKYTIDVIASCAFGLDTKTFESGPGQMTKFEDMASRFKFAIKISAVIKYFIVVLAPKLAEFLGIQTFDVEPQDYFRKVITQVLEHRRKTGQRQNDFLQLMMDAQEGLLKQEENSQETIEVMTGTTDKMGDVTGNNFVESSNNLKIDDDDIIANCVLFLIGGVDTTQSLLISAAYQLALEPECQEKLREEVNNSMEENNGKLTYEAVHGMTYMDMFINETLRYFPPVARTERLCTKDYKLPIENGPVIEKGSIVGLPVIGMQRNPDVYENPDKFDPERFSPHRKNKMHPYAFAPFGHGPRNCIGLRFALTEVKTVIATLVRNFKLEPCSKTDIPMQYGSTSTLKPKNGMHLKIRPIRKEWK